SAFNDDDAFDTDMGWTGKNQFWFSIQSNDKRDNGSEQNGEPNERNDGTGIPAATYEIYNATLIGAGATAGGTANNHGMLLRRYVQAGWYNSIFTDFNGQPLNGGGPQTGAAPSLRDNLWWGFAVPSFTNVLFTEVSFNNATTLDPQLRGISREPDGGLDPLPAVGSPALVGSRPTPRDGFLLDARFKGAFSEMNWASDWTGLSLYGILSSRGGGSPVEQPVLEPSTVTLASASVTGGVLTVSWEGGTGPFVVQKRSSLVDGAWVDALTVNDRSAQIPANEGSGFVRILDLGQ
ncbi:MAG: hypothetical protein IT580_20385, partial [Verrucomicrobiales bacterium]|nr:hypothetical protein [Verrucomicrobiales bacterium]